MCISRCRQAEWQALSWRNKHAITTDFLTETVSQLASQHPEGRDSVLHYRFSTMPNTVVRNSKHSTCLWTNLVTLRPNQSSHGKIRVRPLQSAQHSDRLLKPSEPSPAFKELTSKMGTQDKPPWKGIPTHRSTYTVEAVVLSVVWRQLQN